MSPFVPTLSLDATALNVVQHTVPPGKHRAASARLDEFENLRHPTEESFGECPASPFTPSNHLLPASLLSLTASSVRFEATCAARSYLRELLHRSALYFIHHLLLVLRSSGLVNDVSN